MERVYSDLNNASVINRLGIIITLINGFWDVTHNQQLFGLLSLIDGMIENQIQNSFCDIMIDS